MDLSFWNTDPTNGAYHRAKFFHSLQPSVLMNLKRLELARLGEDFVEKSVELAGWTVVHRSLRRTGFELDLVVLRDASVRVLEVKTIRNRHEDPDLDLTARWLNQRKVQAVRRGCQFVFQSYLKADFVLDSLSFELISANMHTDGSVTLYRWPNACDLLGR
jgi:Holliday junction resolvase-like predicted endonuclease